MEFIYATYNQYCNSIDNPLFAIFSEKCKWNIRGVRGTIESKIEVYGG